MRILYYYWTQFDEKFHSGSGVMVYLRNVVQMMSQNANVEIYALNSGVDYDFSKKIYIKELKNSVDNVRQFSLYNSPVLAPSGLSFYDVEEYLSDEKSKDVLEKFIRAYGPFDVIHFQSLEGLPISVLELKTCFPKTKFVLSIHNYHLFCPQVNLWKNGRENCLDYNEGHNCVNCRGSVPNCKRIKLIYRAVGVCKNIGITNVVVWIKNRLHKYVRSIKGEKKTDFSRNIEYDCSLFLDFRKKNIENVNKYVDDVICVSEKVKNISEKMGIDTKKLSVKYIGTKFAEIRQKEINANPQDAVFCIAYMGYARKDKGFYFLVDALENIDINSCKNIAIKIAAKCDDSDVLKRIENLKGKYYSVEMIDGYTHDTIKDILSGVHLGVVPVQWEDCLPQVAIEFNAMGVPVLSSDLGGASELSKNNNFVFESNNVDDFIKKLMNIKENRELLERYYRDAIDLVTNKEHCEELLRIYS